MAASPTGRRPNAKGSSDEPRVATPPDMTFLKKRKCFRSEVPVGQPITVEPSVEAGTKKELAALFFDIHGRSGRRYYEVGAESCGVIVEAARTVVAVLPWIPQIMGAWSTCVERCGRKHAGVPDPSTVLLDIEATMAPPKKQK